MRISDWSSDVCSSDLTPTYKSPNGSTEAQTKSPRSLGGFLSNFRANFAAADMSGKSGFVGGQIKTRIVKGQQVDALARHVGKEVYANTRRLDQGHDLPDTAGQDRKSVG